MIATLPLGRTGAVLRASQPVLSRAATGLWGLGGPAASPPLNIDGGVGLSASRRSTLPIVLLPLLTECGAAAGRIVNAVYSLQQASLEFRIVVVTDMASFKELRSFGWAISHVQPEARWNSESSWLGYAETEFDRVAEAFGCSCVVETSEAGISAKSWRNLLSMSRLGPDLPNTSKCGAPDSAAMAVHSSWRGWLGTAPAGMSAHKVIVDGSEWAVKIRKNPKSSMVFLRLGQPPAKASANVPDDIDAAWNVVEMHMTADVRSRTCQSLRGVLAIFDALSLDNCGIVETEDHRRSDFSAVLPYIIQTRSVAESDVLAAYRRALSVWSSRGT